MTLSQNAARQLDCGEHLNQGQPHLASRPPPEGTWSLKRLLVRARNRAEHLGGEGSPWGCSGPALLQGGGGEQVFLGPSMFMSPPHQETPAAVHKRGA